MNQDVTPCKRCGHFYVNPCQSETNGQQQQPTSELDPDEPDSYPKWTIALCCILVIDIIVSTLNLLQ